MSLTLGIDVACRAAHQATLARDGKPVWRGRKFFTRPQDLEQLWADLDLADPAELIVVLEPTRNAWIVLADWFRRRGTRVVMVPTTQSADLRAYYAKHTKNDRMDSQILAKLPLLHPEGLRAYTGAGPADPLRRLVKQRSSIVARRTAVLNRLDAQLEILGPAWHEVLGCDLGVTALTLLTRYADPRAILGLGPARLSRFLAKHSHGQWGHPQALALIDAARQSLQLWDQDAMDFTCLSADIAVEAAQAQFLTQQIRDLNERIQQLYTAADPDQVIASAPGVGPVIGPVIAGRIGNPHRFTSLAAVRAYSGLVPKVSQSGTSNPILGITKAGDPLLRAAMFIAADRARLIDPQIAAKYHRLTAAGRHHNSAICTLAADLLTRTIACWRTGQRYQLRDIDGRDITPNQGRDLINQRYPKPPKKQARHTPRKADQESQKSPSAPTSQSATTKSKKPTQAA